MEKWLPVPGFDQYEISDLGRVRSLYRAPRILNPAMTNGYHRLNLGRARLVYVHQLVAQVFIGPCPDGQEVRHLDGCRTNNQASNLAYGTRADNIHDAKRHGTLQNGNQPKTASPNAPPHDAVNTYLQASPRYC